MSIAEYLAELSATEVYDEVEGFHYWPRPHPLCEHPIAPSGTCTNGAMFIAAQFKGEVWGYAIEDNQNAVLGQSCGGHDFAIVGDKLVDWWALNVDASVERAVFDLNADAGLIGILYGDRSKWTKLWPK